jgi:hypothetical protein
MVEAALGEMALNRFLARAWGQFVQQAVHQEGEVG